MNKTVNSEFNSEFLETLSYETPFFIFSKKRIRDNLQKFKRLFPGSSIHYAIKANAEPQVLKTLADAGCGFEVASKYELNMLKEIKIPPKKIIYGTAVKPSSHIKEFYEYGVDRFAFDSLPELEKIVSLAPRSRVYIRVIANDTGSIFKFSEKFGAEVQNVVPFLLRVKELGLYPYGISFHVGSQASDPKAWANTIENLRPIIKELKERGIRIDVLNLGGGYPCKYSSSENVPDLKEIAQNIHEQYRKLESKPKLIIEPGRGIIADTAILVTSVIARIARKGNIWLFLDGGCYNALFETMAYQGSTRYSVTSMRPVEDSGESMFALAGPTGDSQDIITREALLPADIEVGDKLIFHNVGAYSLTTISRFNGFPKPDVYYI